MCTRWSALRWWMVLFFKRIATYGWPLNRMFGQNMIAPRLGVQKISGVTVFDVREKKVYDPLPDIEVIPLSFPLERKLWLLHVFILLNSFFCIGFSTNRSLLHQSHRRSLSIGLDQLRGMHDSLLDVEVSRLSFTLWVVTGIIPSDVNTKSWLTISIEEMYHCINRHLCLS